MMIASCLNGVVHEKIHVTDATDCAANTLYHVERQNAQKCSFDRKYFLCSKKPHKTISM